MRQKQIFKARRLQNLLTRTSRDSSERDVKMAARAMQQLCYHIAWVVIKDKVDTEINLEQLQQKQIDTKTERRSNALSPS